MNPLYVQSVIRSVIEEGRGDISKKMRQRTAQTKYKERELRKMSLTELDDVAAEYNISVSESAHSDVDEIKDNLITEILDNV